MLVVLRYRRRGVDNGRRGPGARRQGRPHPADARSAAPPAGKANTPEIVTAAGTSIITEKSPYIARTSFTLAQSTVPMADWAARNGIKKVVSMVSDYAPGADAEKSFKAEFTKSGGQGIDTIRFPIVH